MLKPEVNSLLALVEMIPQSQRVMQLLTVLGKISHRENINLLVLQSGKEGEFLLFDI